HTPAPQKYQIPDDYTAETTWGRATEAANLFHEVRTKTSGVYLFGLHLKILDEVRKFKWRSNILKQIDDCSNSNLTKHAITIGKSMLTEFNEKVSNLYNPNNILILESLNYLIKGHAYEINYDDYEKIKKKQKTELIVKTLDKKKFSRNSYQDLSSIEFHLLSEKMIYEKHQLINKIMIQFIPISTIYLNTESQIDQTEKADGYNEFIVQEVVNATRKGPLVNLRLSGDGHNVGWQI
ncbi:15991_t:CDS:2, partial [Dentiscutata heterogama]